LPYFLKGFEALLAYSLVAQADVNGMGVTGAPMTDCAGREFRRLWVDSSLTELLVSPSLGFPTHPFPLPDTAPYPAIEFFELGFAVFEAGEVTRPTPKIGVQFRHQDFRRDPAVTPGYLSDPQLELGQGFVADANLGSLIPVDREPKETGAST